MPRLESIHLEGVWICPDLRDIIISRVDTLRSITLRNCMGHAPDEEYLPESRWAYLFQGLAESSPTKLKQFVIESQTKTTTAGKKESVVESVEEAEKMKAIAHIVATQPGRKVFPYRYCDELSGNLWDDKQVSRNAFLRGDDQKQYDRIMEIVAINSR
ncbi:hypothetical protein AAFC00_001573 [Neodothiora populina]